MALGSFQENGSQYRIATPRTPARWFNYLFNDSYYVEVSQTGQGKSMVFQPKHRTFNREGYKYFYLRDGDTGEVWCPAYQPLKTQPEQYECVHALGWSEIRSFHNGIRAAIKVFVPVDEMCEVWRITVTNETDSRRRLSLFSAFSLENGGVMGSVCDFDVNAQVLSSYSYPYHVFYEEKEKCDNHSNRVYVFADRAIESFECSENRFFGGEDTGELPPQVAAGRCSNGKAEGETPIGVLQHALSIEPGGSETIHLVMGCARTPEEAAETRVRLLESGFDGMLEAVDRYWNTISNTFTVETPDRDLNAFMNHWLKKQIDLQTRTNRMSTYCPIRNQLQDAMGFSMIDPDGALAAMEAVLSGQSRSGFIQQWIMTDGSPPSKLCLLTHKDGPVWLVICLTALVNQSGRPSLLDRQVGFKDGGTASIYEHLLLAVDYMAQDTGSHGLCRMGDGDWNDPINGPGRRGRGESVWSTMALKYAILTLLPLCRLRGDDAAAMRLEAIADRLDHAVNEKAWDGAWYLAGFDDEGEAFGTAKDAEGRLFLNTQTWAIMSQCARGERLDQCLAAIDSLDTPAGPLLLKPAFSDWNAKWGRISVKLAGTTENGSVYCHASMFKAFADCQAGRGGQAYETIRRTLPTNPDNPPSRNLQVPIFIPNYYFGLMASPNFGKSSHHNQTGTVGWMLWTVMDYVLGVRATAEGLTISPCIPAEWPFYKVTRTFGGATYVINISNPEGVETGEADVIVNGRAHRGTLLPCEPGATYQVEVTLRKRR
ncbi:glycosyltransferase 36 [Paenibacillus curdlanolyticus YK9]|uniref:Glycosyltransferase 36 n=1 Tax=Paenibacillus curdlanolyticus YK9 TaxID=717606 RepID=E0IAQ7_9BACL|nr:glycosyltransferase 36 [Paenibacillus curdlanolyticus]EFM10461.1 glycosyltransferase 36 [Paenibacillus curdlanolyticus YK9]